MWLACSSARATALKPLFSLLPSKARSMESLCSSLTGTAIVTAKAARARRATAASKLKLKWHRSRHACITRPTLSADYFDDLRGAPLRAGARICQTRWLLAMVLRRYGSAACPASGSSSLRR